MKQGFGTGIPASESDATRAMNARCPYVADGVMASRTLGDIGLEGARLVIVSFVVLVCASVRLRKIMRAESYLPKGSSFIHCHANVLNGMLTREARRSFTCNPGSQTSKTHWSHAFPKYESTILEERRFS